MNILVPDSWLREYLDTKATPQQIKECLSLCGPSVERINKTGGDFVYDIEISSNRIDTASVYGIAREAAAILPRFKIDAKLKTIEVRMPPKPSLSLPMDITDPQKNCNRILGIVMEVGQMKPSPDWVRKRIEKCGVRALNNLVDVTNYVMLEIGHPAHVFDYDRVKTHKFILRRAKKNEPIVTLDGKKYLLNPEDVIIDDGTGRVIDLPGIMGTENSVVTQKTRRIIFFIESNNPVLIRKSSMRYGIRTMAAGINEKHPDPELAKTAMLRGIELYQKLAGGKVAGDIIDIYPNKPKPVTIKTTVEFINERLGIELQKSEIIKILESLRFNVIPSERSESRNLSTSLSSHSREIPRQARDDTLSITPPTFRQFDVTIPEDIVEEVARIYGYHNLPSKLMSGNIPITNKPKILSVEERIKLILKYWGHTEVYNYSFISKDLITKALLPVVRHLKVANPLTEETEYMRISLIPSILENISKNQFYGENLQLFELSKIYLPKEKSLPDELSILTISNQNSFYKLKGITENLLKELDLTSFTYKIPVSDEDFAGTWKHFWHPLQTVSIVKDKKILGYVGKIHPAIAQNFQIKNDVYLAVINIELVSELSNPAKHFTPIPLYPSVIEDITVSNPPKTYIALIISEVYKASDLVKNIKVVDRYKNSITLRITYQNEKKNLGNDEVKTVREQILKVLKTKYKISIKI